MGIGCVVHASVKLFRESLVCLEVIQEHYDQIENSHHNFVPPAADDSSAATIESLRS